MGSGCLQCTVNDSGWSACHDPHSVCVRGPLVGLRPCDVGLVSAWLYEGPHTVENDLFASVHVKAGPGLKAYRLHIILLHMNLNFGSRLNQLNLIDPYKSSGLHLQR